MRLFSQSCQCIHSCRCDITLVQNSVNKFPRLSDFFSQPSLTQAYVLTKCIRWTMWWHTSVEAHCFIFDKYCTMDSIWDLVDFGHTSNLVLGNRSPENEWRMPAMRRYSGNQRRCLLTWIYRRPRARFGRNRRRWNLRIGALLVQCWTSTRSAEMSFTGHCKSLNDHLRI